VADRVSGVVLDVGCGMKPYCSLFPSAASYIGCDWPPEPGTPTAADVLADAAVLPFRSGTFDAVLCTEVLEHLPRPEQCMAELSRVLRDGGTLLITTPFLYWLHEQPRDFYRYTPHALRYLAEEHGLTVEHIGRRGGAGAVLVDLTSKWLHRGIPAFAGKLPGRRWAFGVAGAAVRLPQRAYLGMCAASRLFPGTVAERADRALGLGNAATLGYVMVARKRPRNNDSGEGTGAGMRSSMSQGRTPEAMV
jgi:SAM-dependent methyltransferase